MAQLQKLSEFCGFQATLEDMLRDHLVCGCKDKRLQCKLLAEKDLTFWQALAIAKVTEAAEREVKDLQQSSPALVNTIHGGKRSVPKATSTKLQAQTQKSFSMVCYRCGGKHKTTDCKF